MAKKMFKILGLALVIAAVVAQFIRPGKNVLGSTTAGIETVFPVPDSVRTILSAACYDCHSNNTRYPWYAEIQPVGWFLNDHIQDGKKELNFSEFASYRVRRQYRKLEQMRTLIEENEMPLQSYTLLHKDAVLSLQQKEILYSWIRSTRDSIKAHTPEDSLKMPKRKP